MESMSAWPVSMDGSCGDEPLWAVGKAWRGRGGSVLLVSRPIEEAGRVPVVLLVLSAREHLPERIGRQRRWRRAQLARGGVEHFGARRFGAHRAHRASGGALCQGGGARRARGLCVRVGCSTRCPRLIDRAAVREGRDVDILGGLETALRAGRPSTRSTPS
jgi:hypothetical protein